MMDYLEVKLSDADKYLDMMDKKELCEGYYLVSKSNVHNIEHNGKLLLSEWQDTIECAKDGYFLIIKDSNYNIVDITGKLLFDSGDFFLDTTRIKDYLYMYKNGLIYIVDYSGNLVIDKGFYYIGVLSDGYMVVQEEKYGKYNYIDLKGNLLLPEGVDNAKDFCRGTAVIVVKGFSFLINTSGEIVSKQYNHILSYFYEEGHRRIIDTNRYINLINDSGEELCSEWYSFIGSFTEGYAVVVKEGKYNYINEEGKLLSDEWFVSAASFHLGLGKVRIGFDDYYIDRNGNILPYTEDIKKEHSVFVFKQ